MGNYVSPSEPFRNSRDFVPTHGITTSQLENTKIVRDEVLRQDDEVAQITAHQDAILDLKTCDGMLVSAGRDGLIKIWQWEDKISNY